MSGQFKAFVTEKEVQEQRDRRQAEWERVRKPEDPIECPEEETRSLFDQLQANKELKDRELEDETKLRSSVKGLDDDEVQFLNFVSNRQVQIEKDRNMEEKSVIEEMKNANVVKVNEKKERSPDSNKSSSSITKSNSQKLLLQGAIKRKSTTEANSDTDDKKQKANGDSDDPPDSKLMAGIPKNSGIMVVAGILPGIADYGEEDSSTENESNSSDSEADHMILPSAPTQRILQEMVQRLKEEGCG
ncbi:PSME3-interacting protein-like [Physella acuta]|uniref:PSME3-interacting protein-like n=1 Tax=Physella acuta TaxID=109671 RepID=UPI0027DAF2EE|nr:PSME3-interacting protein-like [Physella acuta]XP_059178239.1 PSME3-interacting protein-like [Physella acuta]XP_059178240.1 PSME3-interacting protein-like [Physella acuta]XP_059178241.1 PSME3-interacting protein-like [Physella acuta]XP_059178242.1 PSME3-interacting protein-like [Physella acuta]